MGKKSSFIASLKQNVRENQAFYLKSEKEKVDQTRKQSNWEKNVFLTD